MLTILSGLADKVSIRDIINKRAEELGKEYRQRELHR